MEASKLSWKETVRLNLRAVALWWENAPQLLVSAAASRLFLALSPYVSIYFTARLLDEIAGACRIEKLYGLVLAVLLSAICLTLLGQALLRWKNAVCATQFYLKERIFLLKFASMDFAALDDPDTIDLYTKIMEERTWGAYGILRVLWNGERILEGLLRIAGAAVLSASLFSKRAPAGSAMEALNHPLFLTAILLGMVLTTVLSSYFGSRPGKYQARYAHSASFGNRIFGFYGFDMPAERERAMDARMYEQDQFAKKALEENNMFSETSQIARWSRGPLGLCRALSVAMSRLFIGVVYLFVCLKAWGGAFGVGSVTQYIAALTSLSVGFSMLLKEIGEMRINAFFMREDFAFLDIPNRMYQGSLSVEKRSDRNYEVEFRDVSFRYPSQKEWALRHVSLKFKVGERLAVVGENGSGKTTMIKLLCRLYDPDEGEILLNGINIRKYNYAEYMNIFSVVFQDFQLLSYSLGQNVAGSVSCDAGRAERCLVDAGFAERLSALPKGLNTCIGRDFDPEGVALSGGEGQKVAIARALYKNAPFIVLDEPTAALDPIAEAEVYASFDRLIQDRTAIYISHRLSSCRFCDRIVVFDKGRLVQFGSHEELVEKTEGKYYALWQAQAQYYV